MSLLKLFKLLEIECKGGIGSGNFGHAGIPGKRGGSTPNKYAGISADVITKIRERKYRQLNVDESSMIKKNGKEYYRLYHGTHGKPASKIKKEGLKKQELGTARWYILITDKQAAGGFAHNVSEESKAKIVTVDIPKDKLIDYLWPGIDYTVGGRQHALQKSIPAKYITKVEDK